ncbi:MAG: type II toxin-antitoxin system VapC family toxin [Bacteroidia bacterium]|nr:type II toxin-antitoxin system VapC family toxin [Bacteroidia bacterium]
MKKIFLDTSSIVKVYHKENDSDRLLNIFTDDIDEMYLSELTKVEFNAALWRKVRIGEANEFEAMEAIRFFENDYYKYQWIDIDSEIINLAKNLLN